jgi:hypothetical protein
MCTIALALGTFTACSNKTMPIGSVPPQSRVAPLTPGTRDQLNRQGAHCSPNTTGPAICTTTNPDCSVTFDDQDQVTHLRCDVGGVIFECTRPCPNIYECTWSDAPGCADLYGANGTFDRYACGQDLQDRLQCSTDAGVGPDSGSIDAGAACHGLGEQACIAQMGCQPLYCAGCNGQRTFVGCGNPGEPVACPAIACPACQGLDHATCAMNAHCMVHTCPDCHGNQVYDGCFEVNGPIPGCASPPPTCPRCGGLSEQACIAAGTQACRADYCDECGNRTFVACSDPSAPPPACPAITCVNCMGLDEMSCSSSSICHPVYQDDMTCGCAPAGCCVHYNHCSFGAKADCSTNTGQPMCTLAPPSCGPNYVPSILNGCWDGCVMPSECSQAPLCGANGTWPTFASACTTDMDCATGIRQTDCCGDSSATGIEATDLATFNEDASICAGEWPRCGCPTRGIQAQDGTWSLDPAHIHVHCVLQMGGTSGTCLTFVQ